MRRLRKISGIKTDVAFVTKANFFPSSEYSEVDLSYGAAYVTNAI